VTNSLDRFGHPFKKPCRNAFIRLDIFGLHNDWWENFKELAHVRTECVNIATSTILACGSYSLGTAGRGPYRGRLATGLIPNHVLGRSTVSVGW
jgi:hypothetical protein